MRTRCRSTLLWALSSILFVGSGCGPKVMVPPKVDLLSYETIGLIEFSSNYEGSLAQFATQKFLEYVQSAQPGLRVIELGKSESILEKGGFDDLDHDAVRAIGVEYGVDALVIGRMEVSELTPKANLSMSLSAADVRADVEASLTARLFETQSGATVWTRSARRTDTVAHVTVTPNGTPSFGASDPDDAYGKLVGSLVDDITEDFRVHYRRM